MTDYIIRIVLHGANATHYANLHRQMAEAGASRTIKGASGEVFDLPDGEYVVSSTLGAAELRNRVSGIASSAKAQPDPSVIVAAYSNIAWQLRVSPGQS